jgi:coproporphyrinogen III oxidase-like Fe-S oxidoreductase
MIFNLPGQTLAMLDADIDALLGLGVDQVSFYPLMTAATARQQMQQTMGQADPSLRHPMYERILDRLLPAYRPSSAWCFTRGEGKFDEYIMDEDDYVGVGSGAFSYVGGAMYSTTFSLNHYCRRVEGGQSGITQKRTLGLRERMRYDFLVRLFSGALKHEYVARRYGAAFWVRMAPELVVMRLLGATRHDRDALRLTRRGMYWWVLMMAEFFNSVNEVRAQMREHIRAEIEAWNGEGRDPEDFAASHHEPELRQAGDIEVVTRPSALEARAARHPRRSGRVRWGGARGIAGSLLRPQDELRPARG